MFFVFLVVHLALLFRPYFVRLFTIYILVPRLREFGSSLKEMDLIDESRLSSEQMRAVVSYM